MVTDRNKTIAVAVLGTLWAGVMAWNWFTAEEPVRVPLANVSGPAAASTSSRGAAGGAHVQLDLLAAARTQREMTFAAPRNIFQAPRPDNRAGPVDDGRGDDPNSAVAMRRQAVAAELAQFHYLGFVRREEEQQQRKGTLAVLTKNDDLHIVKAGEVLEDRVIVKAIRQESVTLQDRESRIEHTLLLSDEPVAQP